MGKKNRKTNSMLLLGIIVALEAESSWHKEHDDVSVPIEFKLGFLTGIAQAIHIIKNIHEFMEDYE